MAIQEAAMSEATEDFVSIEGFKASFRRHLAAEGNVESTRNGYMRTLGRFEEFLVRNGMPTNVHHITRDHVETYMESLMMGTGRDGRPRSVKGVASTQTPRNYYYHLMAFFNFLVYVYEEIPENQHPMRNTKPPQVAERIVRKTDDIDVAAILKTCAVPRGANLTPGAIFRNLRDEGLIRMMIDAGPRLTEVTDLGKNVDLDRRCALVMGKGAYERNIVFGAKTARSLDRYLIARSRHKQASCQYLWITDRGRLTSWGIYQMVRRRARLTGVHVTPHQFRHAWAHALKVAGMRDEELMVLGGWKRPDMMRHYGKSAAAERAAATHARMSPGDMF